MKSIITIFTEKIKNLILILDYLIWFLFDFSKFKKIDKKKIKRVLFIHLGSIGELMTITPLFPALKKKLNCDIEFMLKKGKEEVYKENPYISKVISPLKNFKEEVKRLKEKKFDLAIILYPGSFKNGYMCYKAEIKYRIGCFAGIRGFPRLFFTKRVFPIMNKHVVNKTLDMIRQIGIENKNPKLEFYLNKIEKKEINNFLLKLKIKKFAIVHPGFSSSHLPFPSRLWPLERYAKIIDFLIEKYDLDIFLTGGKKKKFISEDIKKLVKEENKKRVIIGNDFFNLRSLSALISKTEILISCGTGVVHIAAALEKNNVLFEGKGNPIEWEPWNTKKNYKMLYHPEVCTGCEKENCRKKSQECMKAISVEEVKQAISQILI